MILELLELVPSLEGKPVLIHVRVSLTNLGAEMVLLEKYRKWMGW